MISCLAAVVSFARLENLPASGANVSANDFFQSFKLGCEAAGALVPEFLLSLISLLTGCKVCRSWWSLL